MKKSILVTLPVNDEHKKYLEGCLAGGQTNEEYSESLGEAVLNDRNIYEIFTLSIKKIYCKMLSTAVPKNSPETFQGCFDY